MPAKHGFSLSSLLPSALRPRSPDSTPHKVCPFPLPDNNHPTAPQLPPPDIQIHLAPPRGPTPAPSTHRWSDLVPPHTALTFAAVYDPAEGMLTFSAPALFPADLEDPRHRPTRSVPDDTRTVGGSTLADMRSLLDAYACRGPRCGTPGAARASSVLEGRYVDALEERYADALRDGEKPPGATRASSVFEGRYVDALEERYAHALHDGGKARDEGAFAWSWQHRLGTRSRSLSRAQPRIDTSRCATPKDGGDGDGDDSPFNDSGYEDAAGGAGRVFSDYTESDSANASFLGPEPHLRSAFSVTTTSTSAYIDVRASCVSLGSQAWSALEAPDHYSINALGAASSPGSARTTTGASTATARVCPRGLRKARSYATLPAAPSTVLARRAYNHAPRPRPRPSARDIRARVLQRLSSFRREREPSAERWVCVEVEHRVTQHELREDD